MTDKLTRLRRKRIDVQGQIKAQRGHLATLRSQLKTLRTLAEDAQASLAKAKGIMQPEIDRMKIALGLNPAREVPQIFCSESMSLVEQYESLTGAARLKFFSEHRDELFAEGR